MPVILDPDGYDLWLDPSMGDVNAVSDLLKPCDGRLMRSYPVSSRVNSVANDDADCSAAVAIAETQSRLF
jgi:putative SOS response-associated peptidase YedK